MKAYYILVFLILALFSCNEKLEESKHAKDIFLYPTEDQINSNSEIKNIYLDSLENYAHLLKKIDSIACNDYVPVINYSDSESIFKIVPFYGCSTNMEISCPTFRSRIFIQNDSILTNFDIKNPIDSLELILEKHLLNEGKDFNYSDSPDRASLELYFTDDTKSEAVQNLLIEISNKFNKLNKENEDTLYLRMFFRDRALKMIPPPPSPKTNS